MNEHEPNRLRKRLETPAGERPFLVLAELMPLPGGEIRPIEEFLSSYTEKRQTLPAGFALAGITIPQSPNGVSSISPADIYSVLELRGLPPGLDFVPHVTAKDQNVEGIKTYLTGLQKLGLETVLALTGDRPVSGKGVFEVDSPGLIELIKEMNAESFSRSAPGRFDGVHQFFVLAAVSPFKYTEASQVQQYIKMEKKIRSGADALITQMGWDSRKSEELFRYLDEKGIRTPVFGNVYLLTTATPAPRLMFEGKLPGCCVTAELFEKIGKETPARHRERAALQVAMYRDLGAAGVDVGGLANYGDLASILSRAAEIGPNWRKDRGELNFGVRKNEGGEAPFYLYDEEGRRREPSRTRATFSKKHFDFLHRNIMTPGRGLYPAVKSLFGAFPSLRREKGALYRMALAGESGAKALLFECEECGDCFLVENFSLCTLGKCAKGLPNPPCGDADSRGMCAHDPDRRCVGELIYEAAASEGKPGMERLERTVNPGRDAKLEGTASILNYYFHKDHATPRNLIQIGENLHASIARPRAAMEALLALGPDAVERPSAPLDYIVSLIRTQAAHGADYIEVNVDAFGETDPTLCERMMRDYVRLVRRHGRGIPVCVDSGSPEILKAGLEAWYEGAPSAIAPPLLNSVKPYTMDEILPLRARHAFKFVGLLVDVQLKDAGGSYYGVDELHGMARTLYRAAVGKYGFKPGDIFFDSTVFPLAIDMPMTPGTPGYTYRTFETIRRIRKDREMRGVHCSLGITNAVRDLPGRRTGVCRAYLALAQEYGLDAGIVNVLHDYGKRPPAAELVEFVAAFARQDGSAAAAERAVEAMMKFCRANRKPPKKR
jgi:5-methyltetrahydrofolate corrinoid/iron sulfur protein methyltransferase